MGPPPMRVRSSAPSPRSTASPNPSAPVSLAQRVLKSHLQPTTPATPHTPPAVAEPAHDTPRFQFEQQQDFISFDRSPSPPTTSDAAHPHPRKRPRDPDAAAAADDRLQSRERTRSTPWCDHPGVDWDRCRSAIDQLNHEARAFVHYVSPSPQEHQLRLWTIELIRRTIQSAYPDAQVECFGSVGTGLYLPGGDIDLVLLSPSLPYPPLKPSSSLLHRLASLLLTSHIAQPNSLVVIAKARVPIVKFVTRHGAFAVDLSVNQRGGVDAAVRVRSMLEEYAFREEGYVEPGLAAKAAKARDADSDASDDDDNDDDEPEEGELPRSARPSRGTTASADSDADAEAEARYPVDHGVARSLVLLVKAFLAQRGMNEVFTGGLGSYSIICLVISFLQLHPKIQTASVNPNRNLGLLLVEFLELYGKHFNYDQAGITLRGRGGYFNKHDKGWYRPGQPYLLSIEDPNDPQNDVSGGSHAILRVRQTLSGGYDLLTASLCARQSLLQSSTRSTPSSTVVLSAAALPNADSDTSLDPSQRSLLGCVIGLGSAERSARQAHRALHADGTLQALLERGAHGPLSGRQLKRAKKDEREKRSRERTIARLEGRARDKELRRERRRAKRAAEEEQGAAVEDARSKAVDLAPMADVEAHHAEEEGGFVIDTVGSRLPPAKKPRLSAETAAAAVESEEDADEADAADSRYARAAAASASAAPTYTHVPDDSSASSDAGSGSEPEGEGEGSDGDVVLGGTGGDLVRPEGVSRDVTPAPGASGRGRGTGRAAASAKEDRARRRNEYWAAKGVREEGEVDE